LTLRLDHAPQLIAQLSFATLACHAVAVAVILATPVLVKALAGAGVLGAIAVALRAVR
jgi:hypothetical protein